MRSSEAVRHIQQIAAMGLAPRVAIPAMVGALRHVVPANQNPFFWADSEGMITDFYGEDVDLVSMESAMMLSRHNTPDDVPTMDRLLRGPQLVNNTAALRRLPGWHRSAFFNEMLRGNAAENSVDFQLRDQSGIRGAFAISRGVQDRPMQAEEVRRVAALAPYFLHAMNADPAGSAQATVEAGTAAYIICSLAGEIISHSARSAKWILQLYDMPLGSGVKFSEYLYRLPPAAKLVVDRLRLTQSDQHAPPATLDVPTRWGLFRVSAVPMHTAPGTSSDTAIVTIQLLIDKRIRHATRLSATDLTKAERRVALRMAGPGDGDAIARDLGLTVGAYRQYAKRIYMALGVDGRMGLKAMLDN